jgi:hypothetical protein
MDTKWLHRTWWGTMIVNERSASLTAPLERLLGLDGYMNGSFDA